MDTEKIYKAIGPCPICGRTNLWLNDVPLTAFCWGEEGKEHREVRRIVPHPVQVYGTIRNTVWRTANGRKYKKK